MSSSIVTSLRLMGINSFTEQLIDKFSLLASVHIIFLCIPLLLSILAGKLIIPHASISSNAFKHVCILSVPLGVFHSNCSQIVCANSLRLSLEKIVVILCMSVS